MVSKTQQKPYENINAWLAAAVRDAMRSLTDVKFLAC